MCCKNRGSECIATGDRNNLNRGSECIVCVWIGIRMHCNRGSECVATEDLTVLNRRSECSARLEDQNVLQQRIGMYCVCDNEKSECV